MAATPASVEEYLAGLPTNVRALVGQAMEAVKAVAPDAVPGISYRIVGFRVGGRALVYVGGWTRHISVYPVPDVDPAVDPDLAAAIARYRAGPGTLKFPVSEPLPVDVVRNVVRLLIEG